MLSKLIGSRYYRALGLRGLWLSMKAKLIRTPEEFTATVPGIPQPVIMRLKTTDIFTYIQVFLENEYDFELAKLPLSIIDAGANIGLASIYFSQRYPNATIIAIEPERSNFELMCKNVGNYPNIIPLHAALWKENADIDLIDPGLGHWGFQATEATDEEAEQIQHKVPGLTVDTIMDNYGMEYVDILKIDIEGAEKEVFENASAWIGRTGVTFIELHEDMKPGCEASLRNATRDFEYECRMGENVFLARKAYVPEESDSNVS